MQTKARAEGRDFLSPKSSTTGSLASIPVHNFTRPTTMSHLHKAYGDMKRGNFSSSEVDKFKKTCVEYGYKPGSKFDKVLEDPEPEFKTIVKELDDFKKPTRKDWIKDAHEPNHPRYRRNKEVAVGTPQNDKLRAFKEFEMGRATEDELRQYIGEEDFKRVAPILKNTEDGRTTQAMHELMIDQQKRHMFNDKPVRNNTELFAEKCVPSYSTQNLT